MIQLPRGTILLTAVGVLVVGWLVIWGSIWRDRAVDAKFRADSIEAVADTTRRLLSGDLQIAERRASQLTGINDSLAKANQRLTKTLSIIRITTRGTDTVLVSVVEPSPDGVRVGDYQMRSEPFTLRALDSLPAAPDSGRLHLWLTQDTARLQIETQCGKPVAGLRPATIAVVTPFWLTATIDTAQTTRVVCNEEGLRLGLPSFRKPALGFVAGALAMLGLVLVVR